MSCGKTIRRSLCVTAGAAGWLGGESKLCQHFDVNVPT